MNRQPTTPRDLDWEACYNARDLGGLPTLKGGCTRWRTIVRADVLSRLTTRGRQALLDYGVRTVIDLRTHKESRRPASSARAYPLPDGVTRLHIPLDARDPRVIALMDAASTKAQIYCINLDHYPQATANIMRAIIEAPAGVAIHCHSGKDRTGIIAALLLALAGVSRDVIAADYAASQARLWPLYEQLLREAGEEERQGFWFKPITTPETMHDMLAHLDARYGGVRGYLTATGLMEREIDLLGRRLYRMGKSGVTG